jgi:hypothetical protein
MRSAAPRVVVAAHENSEQDQRAPASRPIVSAIGVERR